MEESESKGSVVPEGVAPVFLSGATQQIFNAVADNHVTSENPNILITKASLLEDIKNRAAVSDFKPLKDKIQSYDGEELLLVYDYDFRYGENFYLCLTEAAKDLILNPPEDVMKFNVSRKRRLFGREIQFSDYSYINNKELYTEVTPVAPGATSQENILEIKRLELEQGTQAIPEVADKIIQSKWSCPVNACTQYEPRTFSEEEQERVWKSEEMQEFMKNVTPRMELCLQQNEIMDIFPDDYLLLSNDDGIVANTTDTNLKEYQSFTDLKFSKDKVVTCIDWHPTIKGIVAVSVGEPYSLNERIELSFKLVHSNSLVLLWSFTDPIHPQLFLEAPEDILCFKFNPSNPNLIVGGCINGQVVIWDITDYQERLQIHRSINTKEKGPVMNALFNTEPKLDHAPIVSYVALSSIDAGHSKGVTGIEWIPDHLELSHKTLQFVPNGSNYCSQLVTSGLDGNVLFWDMRPLSSKKYTQNKSQPTSDPDSPYHYLHLIWKPFYK
uniref:WD repeat-containing protein 63 n=1 Tax=Amphimedon queenslandica TaxID=400682 RepID=A0A1X7T7A3_AMPQE